MRARGQRLNTGAGEKGILVDIAQSPWEINHDKRVHLSNINSLTRRQTLGLNLLKTMGWDQGTLEL